MEGITKKWEPINFIFYLSLVKWPILVVAIIEIVSRLLISRLLEDWSLGRTDLIMWLIRLVAFIYIGRQIGKAYGEVPPIGALAGASGGLILGIIISLFRFYSGFRVWKIFNLVSETTLMIFIGALTAFLIVYLWELWPKKLK